MSAILQAGKGDVFGPAGAVDGDVAIFSGATGKFIKTTGVQISSLLSPQPGYVVQVVYAEFSNWVSSASIVPTDDTIPQINEGVELMTATITPVYLNSKFLVNFTGAAMSAIAIYAVFALFRNSVANALRSEMRGIGATGHFQQPWMIQCLDAPAQGSLTPIVYRIRYGPASAGTIYVNGNNSNHQLGATQAATMTIMEIKQ